MMKKLMLGNEAVARGAYEAGVSVVSSYPGTPSTEITENIVKYDDIYVEWAPNEKVAAEVAIGASTPAQVKQGPGGNTPWSLTQWPISFHRKPYEQTVVLYCALPMTKVCTHHRMNRIHVTMQRHLKYLC